jgi:hypothetical protein
MSMGSAKDQPALTITTDHRRVAFADRGRDPSRNFVTQI